MEGAKEVEGVDVTLMQVGTACSPVPCPLSTCSTKR